MDHQTIAGKGLDLDSMESILKQMDQQSILIIGDVMIDTYLWGSIERISPEAPVPIVNVEQREDRLGGAANVALNIKSLGARPILCAAIGGDQWAPVYRQLMKDAGIRDDHIVEIQDRPTTKKTRIISKGKHILRFDNESTASISSQTEEWIMARIEKICATKTVGVAVLQDYNKGLLTPTLISKIIETCHRHDIQVAVDPKKQNFFAYRNVDLFKPNLKELNEGLGISIDPDSLASLDDAAARLKEQIAFRQLLVTLSDKGVYFTNGKGSGSILPAHVRKIADVSGAGDTVISVASAAMAAGATLKDIAWLSNLAGGLVCEKVGVVPIEKSLLLAEASA